MNRWPNKDPGDSRQYGIDFGPDLTDVGGAPAGTLINAAWTIPPASGLVNVTDGLIGSVAVIRLSGGNLGEWACTCTATTSTGDIIERSASIFVTNR